MYLGYNIGTTLGSLPAYLEEYNISVNTLPGQYVAVRSPSADMLGAGNAVLLYPLISDVDASLLRTADGSILGIDAVAPEPTLLGPSVYLMTPVQSLPANATIGVVMIGLAPVIVAIICVAICMSALAVILVSQYYTSAWVQAEYYAAQEAYYDYLVECQRIITDETVDLNNDGVPDVRNIVWANGRSVSLAVSEYGVEALGGETYVTNDEGYTADPPEEPDTPLDFSWVLIAVVGVVGLVVVMKMLGSGQSGGLTILKS